jgi:transketolase
VGTCRVPVERVGIADTFAESGLYEDLLDKYDLNAQAIVAAVLRVRSRTNSRLGGVGCEGIV